MPALIPREGLEGRIAQLREAHASKSAELAVIEARIAETEYWLATIEAIENDNAPQPEPVKPARTRRVAGKD